MSTTANRMGYHKIETNICSFILSVEVNEIKIIHSFNYEIVEVDCLVRSCLYLLSILPAQQINKILVPLMCMCPTDLQLKMFQLALRLYNTHVITKALTGRILFCIDMPHCIVYNCLIKGYIVWDWQVLTDILSCKLC